MLGIRASPAFSPKSRALCSPAALAHHHPLPQDTAEYVAYVAKDPVNQRGEAAAEAGISRASFWGRFGAAQWCREGLGPCKGSLRVHRVGSRGAGFNSEVPCSHLAVPFPACHILECPEGLAQDVISTIGQAFELRFKQYLKNPPKLVTPHDR